MASTWNYPLPQVGQAATESRVLRGLRAAIDLHDNYGLRQSFHGLHMKSSDVTTVELLNCKDVIMQDGFNYSNLSSLVGTMPADLDTGVEESSMWYEIYLLARSDTEAKKIAFHKARLYPANPTQIVGTSTTYGLRSAANRERLWQSFTAAATAPLSHIDVTLHKNGTLPASSIWLTLESDAAGVPSGTVLATSDVFNPALIGAVGTFYSFFFRSLPVLNTGTVYHIVARAAFTISGTDFITWLGVTPSAVTGQGGYFDGTNYVADATFDFTHRIYQQIETDLVLPTGYDRYCRLGFVYNDASSNFLLFVQVNRKVHLPMIAQGTFVNTTPVLAIWSTIIPPVPCITSWGAGNATAGQAVAIAPPHSPATGHLLGAHTGYAGVAGTVNPTFAITGVATEAQRNYVFASGGTGQMWSHGYEW